MPTKSADQRKNKEKGAPGNDWKQKGGQQRGHFAIAIENAKTPLGFFVLVVVAVELMLTAAVAKVAKEHELAVVYGMLFVVVLTCAVVAFFAHRNPGALLGSAADRPLDHAVQSFAKQISGYWWQWVTPKSPSALSFVHIRVDPSTGTLKMNGQAYSDNGEPATEWNSVATCINVSEHKVFYYWKGGLVQENPVYEGFGEFSFLGSLEIARGFFSDAKLTDTLQNTTITKKFNVRRAAGDDAKEMYSGDRARVSARVLEREKQRPHLG